MNWFFIALAAPFLWALVNICDDYLVVKFSKGKYPIGALVLFSSVIGIFVALAILVSTPHIFSISLLDKLILLFVGGFSICWIILYLFALEVEDVSAVVPWFLTIPVFGYIIGYIFLGEVLASRQIIGSIVVLLGALIISIDFSRAGVFLKKKIVMFMLLSCLVSAINGALFKYVATTNNFWISSFWEYTGLGIVGILIFIFVPKYRNAFFQMNKEGGKMIFTLNVSSEITTIFGNLLTNYAILLAPISLVFLVSSYQPVMVLLFSFICSKFFPWIVNEEFTFQKLWPKLIAIVVMIIGSTILFL